ncbi:histidine phosphatase family protein [Acetobacter farinalis]|uniref:Histidine phosphatase family protein n=1 Tax=Acetobacter farinalis TaxID=1260984 RepID=A0ABT3Q921_9PROT|nr:histidine phosphatase family protein [Acetobacter farinalis]MCX2561776.1 histidine phosphatase family protein [Acetobacter farinalis]NHO30305.1 phosphoglycerate mutase [Acetobacter farinalis]
MAQSFPVLLVRHAPVMVPDGMCYGRQDVALRPGWEGMTSGLAVLAQGAVCEVLYSSPAARCQQMARKLAATTGMDLRIDARLAELDFGEWEGQLWENIDRGLLDAWAADPEGFVPPGGESGGGLGRRVLSFWQDVHQAGTPACVLSHGGPLRVLSALAAGTPPELLAPSMPQGFARLFMVDAHVKTGAYNAAPETAPGSWSGSHRPLTAENTLT